MRLALSARGAEIDADRGESRVATLRLSLKGCGTSAAGIEQAVRDALLTAVPELSAVTFVPAERARRATFVPLDSLMRPAPSPHGR